MTQAELAQLIQPRVAAALGDLADYLDRLGAAQDARAIWQRDQVGERPILPSRVPCPDTIDKGDRGLISPARIRAVHDWYIAQTDPRIILFCLHNVPKEGPVKAGSIADYYAAAYAVGRGL